MKRFCFLIMPILAMSIQAAPVQPDSQLFAQVQHYFAIPDEFSATLEFDTWATQGTVQSARFRFKSLDNGYATGTAVRPVGEGPYPMLLVLYGLSHVPVYSLNPGINLVSQAPVVYVALDPPHQRNDREFDTAPGSLRYTADLDVKEQIQVIRDLRTALSLFSAQQYVDKTALAFYGYSYGAAMGGILAAVEPRLNAVILASGTGGRATRNTSDPMYAIDPIHFVMHIPDMPILLQNGENDQNIDREAALLFQQTVSSSQKVMIMRPVGHMLSCDLTREALQWLGMYITLGDVSNYNCSRLPIL